MSTSKYKPHMNQPFSYVNPRCVDFNSRDLDHEDEEMIERMEYHNMRDFFDAYGD